MRSVYLRHVNEASQIRDASNDSYAFLDLRLLAEKARSPTPIAAKEAGSGTGANVELRPPISV